MNKTVLITGATSGIGEACAEKFAESGYNLIITGRREDRLLHLQKRLEGQYAINIFPLVFDVQNREAVFAAILSIPPEWNIDILINNAGLALGRDHFETANLDDWETMLNTNVHGLLYVSKAVIPFMVKAKSGHIVNLGSVAAKEIYEKGNVYCASKAAVDAISHSMRIDLLQHRIKVTAIHPGAVKTEFGVVRFKGDAETADKVYDGFTPLTAAQVADVIYYCCTLPENVCINDLVLTCTSQADALYFNRKNPG